MWLTDVNIGQYLTAGDDVDLLRHGLQVVQDQSDAVGRVDDGALRRIQLCCCTLHLSRKQLLEKINQKITEQSVGNI